MPEISRFYGIVIKMYFADHPPPHIHAEYSGDEMIVGIQSLSLIAGRLPQRAAKLVFEWVALHQAELMTAWNEASNMQAIGKIAPLP